MPLVKWATSALLTIYKHVNSDRASEHLHVAVDTGLLPNSDHVPCPLRRASLTRKNVADLFGTQVLDLVVNC